MPRHYEDFTGKEINGIIVKKIVKDSGGAGKHKKWICECKLCKNEFIMQSNHLKDKTMLFCKECIQCAREDLTGCKFGNLTVDYMINPGKYKRSLCSCTCDCGATDIIVQANHLKSGEIKSCGCQLSRGEEQIAFLLTDNNVQYIKQATFPDLKYKKFLRFDFYLPELNLVIEYNGKQHYEPIDFFGGEEGFIKIQKRDKLKREYCEKYNINYLIIRYDEDIYESLIMNNIIMKR